MRAKYVRKLRDRLSVGYLSLLPSAAYAKGVKMRASLQKDRWLKAVPGFFDRWAEKRTGLKPDRLTLRVFLERVPKRSGLRFGETKSRLGGRIDTHLERLTDEELQDWVAKGEEVLKDFAETDTEAGDSNAKEQDRVPSDSPSR